MPREVYDGSNDIDLWDCQVYDPVHSLILTMPFTGSISDGMVLGVLSYVLVKVCTGRHQQVSVVMYILSAFFVLKYISELFN
jgi:AGZA family xanthine/uracil permease-like MFS transporter